MPNKTSRRAAILSMLGRGPKDIELPNERGRRDPKLPTPPGEALRKAFEGYQELKKRMPKPK